MGYWNVPEDWGNYYSTCGDCGGRYHASGSETCDCPECPTCGMQVPPGTIRSDGTCQNCAPPCFYCEERPVNIEGPQKEPICDMCKTEHYDVTVSTMLLDALALAGESLQSHIPADKAKQPHVARALKELRRLRKFVDEVMAKAPKPAAKAAEPTKPTPPEDPGEDLPF